MATAPQDPAQAQQPAADHTAPQGSGFPSICIASLQRRGVIPDGVDDSGAQNCVVFAGEVAYRFPRHDPDRVAEVARRHATAYELGLPSPEVLSVAAGEVGQAHVGLRRVRGRPLQELRGQMTPGERARAANQIVQVLLDLRTVTADRWPHPAAQWSDLWQRLVSTANARAAADITDAPTPEELELAAAALRAAAAAPLGLLHGDLAWSNLMFTDGGELTAILDWDFAVIADPAIDLGAVLLHLPDDMVATIHQRHPYAMDDLHRYHQYLATWDLQHRLWQQDEAAGRPTTWVHENEMNPDPGPQAM